MKKEHGRSATVKGAKGTADWEELRALPDPEIRQTSIAPSMGARDMLVSSPLGVRIKRL